MKTTHRIICRDSRDLTQLPGESVHLVITSPPYPMIKMWDDTFCTINSEISELLEQKRGYQAFLLMHEELDRVWKECYRITKPGGIVCINVGDAARTLDGQFQLFSNHSQIINRCTGNGFINLPNIIWRKPTNSPTKFMGSGMLPPGAYVTLEHEYILIFRKGQKREFAESSEKQRRRESAVFWEERNRWFSDIWTDLTGVSQKMKTGSPRSRSAAFPLELAYRLVNMFSITGDTVLDPFMGTGTTNIAAVLAARNSVGIDINSEFVKILKQRFSDIVSLNRERLQLRLDDHKKFVKQRLASNGEIKYTNNNYEIPVISRQECDIQFYRTISYQFKDNTFTAEHEKF